MSKYALYHRFSSDLDCNILHGDEAVLHHLFQQAKRTALKVNPTRRHAKILPINADFVHASRQAAIDGNSSLDTMVDLALRVGLQLGSRVGGVVIDSTLSASAPGREYRFHRIRGERGTRDGRGSPVSINHVRQVRLGAH
jgi:hypothetical protein